MDSQIEPVPLVRPADFEVGLPSEEILQKRVKLCDRISGWSIGTRLKRRRQRSREFVLDLSSELSGFRQVPDFTQGRCVGARLELVESGEMDPRDNFSSFHGGILGEWRDARPQAEADEPRKQ